MWSICHVLYKSPKEEIYFKTRACTHPVNVPSQILCFLQEDSGFLLMSFPCLLAFSFINNTLVLLARPWKDCRRRWAHEETAEEEERWIEGCQEQPSGDVENAKHLTSFFPSSSHLFSQIRRNIPARCNNISWNQFLPVELVSSWRLPFYCLGSSYLSPLLPRLSLSVTFYCPSPAGSGRWKRGRTEKINKKRWEETRWRPSGGELEWEGNLGKKRRRGRCRGMRRAYFCLLFVLQLLLSSRAILPHVYCSISNTHMILSAGFQLSSSSSHLLKNGPSLISERIPCLLEATSPLCFSSRLLHSHLLKMLCTDMRFQVVFLGSTWDVLGSRSEDKAELMKHFQCLPLIT